MLSDLKIAQSAKIKPIVDIAKKIGISRKYLELYGDYKAKISLDILKEIKNIKNGKYIDVTAITPTPLGEGKTVTTIGLAMSLNRISKHTITCIRQPSLGPVFGIKGGAAGGGYSQVVPMEDFNLHFTGDVHAISLAHNLCAAFLDNALYRNNKFNIDMDKIFWRRVVDVSDRSLREITVGLGSKNDGVPRGSGFDISVASELMAILALSEDVFDLRKRIGRVVVAMTKDGKAITAEDLKVAGAMTVLLKDAIKPNLVQTLENTPVFVHAGPFANIAHGNSSILADRIALKLADFVVTESGFGADCGAEKFFDIKCRYSGLKPDVAVLVCSIRALKMHSGKFKIVAGKPLDEALLKEDLEVVKQGCSNLEKQIENIRLFGIPCVVAINRFTSDTDKELEVVRDIALKAGAFDVAESQLWAKGSKGGIELAKAVVRATEGKNKFHYLYPLSVSIKEKIDSIAKNIYGASSVSYSSLAEGKIALYTKLNYDKFPVCMAKTHLSLSHDPVLKGRPRDFVLPIKDLRVSAGAGFLTVLCGEIRIMPGLPSVPAGEKIDIDKKGNVVGLF